ncbi:MAG: tetratricopeptide repeat protein [Rhizomicrobium sp.]|nr:tetratricopeptide repeat protein [Rhizomicrobium sp.]
MSRDPEHIGRYDDAATLFGQLYHVRSERLGSYDPKTTEALLDFAMSADHAGRYGEAEKGYATLLEGLTPETSPAALETRNRMAAAILAQNHYTAAAKAFDDLMHLWIKVEGENGVDTLLARAARAAANGGGGHFAEAERECRLILAKLDLVNSEEAAAAKLEVTNNLAVVLEDEGRFAAAEASYQSVYAALAGAGLADSDDALSVLNNIAAVMADRGHFAEAERLFRTVWLQRQKHQGKDHPVTLIAANNVAAALGAQGQFGEALPLTEMVYEARRTALGSEDPDTLATLTNVAIIRTELGRHAEALEPARQSWKALEKVAGEHHPFTLNALDALATVLERLGRYDEARPYAERMVADATAALGADHPTTLLAQSNLADILGKSGQTERSEQIQATAVTGFARRYGPDQPQTVKTRATLGILRCRTLHHCALGLDDLRVATDAVWRRAKVDQYQTDQTALDLQSTLINRTLRDARWIFAAELDAAWLGAQQP